MTDSSELERASVSDEQLVSDRAASPVVVSVVIPCYNARELLASCLASIEAHPPVCTLEIIVVDDASEDGTGEMVRARYPYVRLMTNPTNAGYGRSTNRGIDASRSRFVYLVNSDVEIMEGAIDELVSFLEQNELAGAAGSLLYNSDGTLQASAKALPTFKAALFGNRSFINRFWPENRFTRKELLQWRADLGEPFPAGYLSSASLMVRRDVLDSVGNLDAEFFHFIDADLCKRIANLGLEVFYVPSARAIHHEHRGGSMASLGRRLRGVAVFHSCAYRYYTKHSGTTRWHPARAFVLAGIGSRLVVSGVLQLGREAARFAQTASPESLSNESVDAPWENAPRPEEGVDIDVSLVVTNYKSRNMLQRCLSSIVNHETARRCELLVVDDCSQDGSAELVRERFPSVRLLENRQNLGYGSSCNLGIAEARGKYVLLLNNDVELLPGVVDELAEFLDAHPEAGAAGSLLYNSDGSVQGSVKPHPSPKAALFGKRSLIARWFPNNRFTRAEILHWRAEEGQPFEAGYVSSASLLVRRELFARVGGLDRKLTYFNDADLCRRVWRSGKSVYYVPAAKAIHHDHKGGTMVNVKRRLSSVVEFHKGAYSYFRSHSGLSAWNPVNPVVALALCCRFVPSVLFQVLKEIVIGLRRSAAPRTEKSAG